MVQAFQKKGETFETSCEKNLNKNNLDSLINHSRKFIIKKYPSSKLVFFVRLKYFGSNTIISLPLKNKNINKIKSLFKKNI